MRLGIVKSKTLFSFASALAFHYLCFTKIGCGSTKNLKRAWLFCVRLSLSLPLDDAEYQSITQDSLAEGECYLPMAGVDID